MDISSAAPTPDQPGPLWDYHDAAAYTKISYRHLRRLVAAGDGPAVVRLGRSVRFQPADVRAWVANLAARSSG